MELRDSKEFILSLDPRKIPFQHYQKDFTFVVNGKEYPTSRYVADILSPKICQYHFSDETIDSFNINIDETDEQCDFSDVLSLLSFDTKPIKKENLSYFIDIFLILGNKQAFFELLPRNPDEITVANVFDTISNKQKYFYFYTKSETDQKDKEFSNEFIKQEIDFIANHFYEINFEKLQQLETSIIEEIIQNENLKLKDEDSLMRFIIELYQKKPSLSYLFENIEFLNISNEELDHFYQTFDLDDINGRIWNSIINRLINSKVDAEEQMNNQDNERYHSILINHDRSNEFNGIIKYLTVKSGGGNIHDKGIIEVSTNLPNSEKPPKNLLDFNRNTFFEANGRNAWILFDFKNMRIQLESYSIKSFSSGVDQFHLKNWIIEVSQDNENWTTIDSHSNCSTLNGNAVIGTFDVQPSHFVRYVRLRQTGELWGDGYMWLHEIEFYGRLQE